MKYDVIIAGGGTAGVSCAYNAAKLGLKVLLIEKNSYLGGTMTSSLVIPAMKTSDNAINTTFFDALYSKLQEMNGAITYSDGNKGWFNPELTKIALDELLSDVDIIFESKICSINLDKNKILSLSIESIDDNNSFAFDKNLLSPIETKYVVDATGDAKIFQKLNCNFLENNFNQPCSLRFIMSGIDTKQFTDWIMKLDSDRDVTTSCKVNNSVHVSTAYTWDTDRHWALEPLFKKALADGILQKQDTNYFQLFSVAGTSDSIAFNAPRLLDSTKSRTKLYIEGRSSIYRLANFCKTYLAGFKNAHISNIANSIGVRVSRRIQGKYVYTYDDLITGKKFDNPVLVSNYPVDIHSNKKNSSVLEKVTQEYQLPIESLMSKDYENLFAIGRCISADFKAQAALRIIPSCFSMGEGLAKYLAKN